MNVDFQLPQQRSSAVPVALVVGNLDGVHRGHQRLLKAAKAAANSDGQIVAVTFDPHPRCVLRPDDCPASLTTLDEKRHLLERAGVDRLCVVNFTHEVSQWSAEDFCQRILDAFALREWIVGPDFAVGHDRAGNIDFLRRHGDTHGYQVTEVGPVLEGDSVVSSSRIRAALTGGAISEANAMLGFDYFIDATVEHGEHVGRELGFPTANLAIGPNKCLPQRGIYTGWADVGGNRHMAAINVGYRPTFGGTRLVVEAHLLDFRAEIYGELLRLSFVERLREERTYPGAAELVEQMEIDVATARERLGASRRL